MDNQILYIVLNKSLKMSPGKAAAQAVHAAMMLATEDTKRFRSLYKRTVIVLEAENAEQIKNLQEYLDAAEISSDYYIDEGANQVSPYSVTALAVEPIDANDSEKRAIFEQFPLFTGQGSYIRVAEPISSTAAALCYLRLVKINWPGGLLPWYVNKTIKWLEKR